MDREQTKDSPISKNVAGFWIRWLAAIADGLILLIFNWVTFLLGMFLVYHGSQFLSADSVSTDFIDYFEPFWLQFWFLIYFLIVEYLYFSWTAVRFKKTPGKALFKLALEDSENDQQEITWWKASVRFLGYILSYLPFGAGYLMVLFHPEKKALHDLLSKTHVVFDRSRS